MQHNTLLNVLSPQLQALVEASLGEKLPTNASASDETKSSPSAEEKPAIHRHASPSPCTSMPATHAPSNHTPLNPSELFGTLYLSTQADHASKFSAGMVVLRHPDSPGFIVRNNFLGSERANAVHDALLSFAKANEFTQAGVGYGERLRNAPSIRGDRIHWIQRNQGFSLD